MPASARLEYRFATRLAAVPVVRRTIALLATQTLDDLHHAVRSAHGWDDDHLYSFWLKGRYWADDGSEYTHPIHAEMPDPLARYTGAASKKSAAIALTRLRLKPGQQVAYVFDFGDEWRVDIRLDRIVAAGQFYPRGHTGGLFVGGLAGADAGSLLGTAGDAVGLVAGSLAGREVAGGYSGLPDTMLIGVSESAVYGFAGASRRKEPETDRTDEREENREQELLFDHSESVWQTRMPAPPMK